MNSQNRQRKERSDTETPPRGAGFYWVMFPAGQWIVARFDGETWLVCGEEYLYFDNDFEKIDNHKIQFHHE